MVVLVDSSPLMLCYEHTLISIATIMLNDDNFQLLDRAAWLELAREKISARQQLLELPPQAAQAILNRVIDPALLKPDFSHGFEFNSLSLTDDRLED
jgi:hypothetical protein